MKIVDHFDPTPKYLQIATSIRDAILEGDLEPLDPIPSETDLVQMHGVARKTARAGVRVLADEGWVFTLQSRGSFVNRRESWPEQGE